MSYFTQDDLPYYYALSEQVTIGDQYHQSTFTQTCPNRLHLFSGSNGLSVGQKPFIDNSEPNPGHTWTTVGEVLESANISWRVYQVSVRVGVRMQGLLVTWDSLTPSILFFILLGHTHTH